jgi:antitoxin (DNA-binding transcriptional repressor) of toxin-antitoxin stability system
MMSLSALWHNLCHNVAMPSVNLRQLRDTKQVKEWLRAGHTVEVRDRDEVIGDLIPRRKHPHNVEMPDFAARRKQIFGGRIFDTAEILNEVREDRF